MFDINNIYEKEKIINSHFKEKYDYKSEDIFNKQVLQLLCELNEFAYETKCFKYWKNERQSSASITVPEFADALMVTLSFCDLAGISKLKIDDVDKKDMVKLFIETINIASTITTCLEEDKLLKILSNLIALSKLLGYTDEELSKYCIEKMDKTLAMIKS